MTTATKVLAAINLLGAVISIALLAATWFDPGYIDKTAWEIAMKSTRPRLESAVKDLRKLVTLSKWPPSIEKKWGQILKECEADPELLLMKTSDLRSQPPTEGEFPEFKEPLFMQGLISLIERVEEANVHFIKSHANLILDLRLFCGTNACAFLLAAWLLFAARTKQMRNWLGAWSLVLLIATTLGILMYVGQSWTWNLLLNRHLGWAYASLHALTAIYLIYTIRRPHGK